MNNFLNLVKMIESNIEKNRLSKAIILLGKLVDESWNLKKITYNRKAIEIGEKLLNFREIDDKSFGLLHYYLGVAYGDLEMIENQSDENIFAKQIYYYRKTIKINQIDDEIKCRVLINMGNLMSIIGRDFDAIDYFEQALRINPNHGMALGNKAISLHRIASQLYDENYMNIILLEVYRLLKLSLDQKNIYYDARYSFKSRYDYIKDYTEKIYVYYENYYKEKLNITNQEDLRYRRWCLNNKLFVNPLNEVINNKFSARDVYCIPSITAKISEGPYYHAMFNNIKQEYVSARYIYYEALENDDTHFSDKEVKLFNTLDYTSLCYSNEKVKASFRILYSLLDKIAYFVNLYFDLKMNYKAVSFRSIWKKKVGKKYILRQEIDKRLNNNNALKALYWLSREIFEKDVEKIELSDECKNLSEIRNYLEHKFLRIHDMNISRKFFSEPEGFAMDISRYDFQDYTLKLMKIVRNAIMYLSLAIKKEEDQKQDTLTEVNAIEMPITTIPDEWKI